MIIGIISFIEYRSTNFVFVWLVVSICVWGIAPQNTYSRGYTAISISDSLDHEVRLTSGKAIYVEGLVNDSWMSLHHAANGRIPFPYWRSASPAFTIRVSPDPGDVTGTVVVNGWKWVSTREEAATERGARHVAVALTNSVIPIDVRVHTLLDGTPIFVRWLEVMNRSEKPMAIYQVSPWSGRLWSVPHPFTLGYQTEDTPGLEGWFHWKPLGEGRTIVESEKGNGQDDPFFLLRNEAVGEYFIGSLAWSANWRIEFDNNTNETDGQAGLGFKFGPSAKDPLRVVDPNETVETPALHLGHIEGDLDTTVQAMHDHLRCSVLPPPLSPERSHRIEYNMPGDQTYYTGLAFNATNVIKSIDVAASIGAKLFLLDCPWYDVYGEWTPSPDRFPHGLEAIVRHTRERGLLFGLQTEAEGGRGNWEESRVKKEHPDWFGEQNVLHMESPEVAQYMESELASVLDRYSPDLYRHEYIPGFTYEGLLIPRHGFLENNYWRYYDALYGVWDRIRLKYPNLILQMCANGGTREDLGMAARFHESYTNEGELGRVLRSFSGKTLSLPPEILVIGNGARPEQGHLDTDLRVSFTISTPQVLTGAAPSVEELSPERKELYLHYTNLYKNFIRPILPSCKVYHHAPVTFHDGVTSIPWFAMEYGAPDRSRGWATVVRLDGHSDTDTYVLKLRGLSPGRSYRVTFDSLRATVTVDGLHLSQEGLEIRLESVMSSELLLFESL